MKTRKISGINKGDINNALREFLRVYRDTPHSSTQVSPNMMLLGYGRSCSLPKFEPRSPDMSENAELHKKAQVSDAKILKIKTHSLVIIFKKQSYIKNEN